MLDKDLAAQNKWLVFNRQESANWLKTDPNNFTQWNAHRLFLETSLSRCLA